MLREGLSTIVKGDNMKNYKPVITVETNGCFDSLNDKFEKLREIVKLGTLDKYGRQGVEALRANTPVDTGKTAASWEYKIVRKTNSIAIQWYNTNKNDGVPIAIILQYGHGTPSGTYVQGVDYINPAMRPVFDEISQNMWREVTEA